jgi:hypothetical protein
MAFYNLLTFFSLSCLRLSRVETFSCKSQQTVLFFPALYVPGTKYYCTNMVILGDKIA